EIDRSTGAVEREGIGSERAAEVDGGVDGGDVTGARPGAAERDGGVVRDDPAGVGQGGRGQVGRPGGDLHQLVVDEGGVVECKGAARGFGADQPVVDERQCVGVVDVEVSAGTDGE